MHYEWIKVREVCEKPFPLSRPCSCCLTGAINATSTAVEIGAGFIFRVALLLEELPT